MNLTLPYWLDEATGIKYAKDCPTCGGSGDTCGTCHGSGVVPADACPEDVAQQIRAANQRLKFDADQDWDYDKMEDEE